VIKLFTIYIYIEIQIIGFRVYLPRMIKISLNTMIKLTTVCHQIQGASINIKIEYNKEKDTSELERGRGEERG